MADGKKVFMNKNTGEIIWRRCRLSAVHYFKADGRKYGYSVKKNDILDADGIMRAFGIIISRAFGIIISRAC